MVSFEDHTLDDAAAELREAALRGDNTRTIYTSLKNKPCPFVSGCVLTGYCRGCAALQECEPCLVAKLPVIRMGRKG